MLEHYQLKTFFKGSILSGSNYITNKTYSSYEKKATCC